MSMYIKTPDGTDIELTDDTPFEEAVRIAKEEKGVLIRINDADEEEVLYNHADE